MKAFADHRKSKPVFRRHVPAAMVDQAGRGRCLQRAQIRQILDSPGPQFKLTIGAPDDVYEQEADRVAAQVMRMPDPSANDVLLQPLCTECEEEPQRQSLEEDEEDIRAKEVAGTTPSVTPEAEAGIASLRGGGLPLPESTRQFFEPRFGKDFSGVRVHTDDRAAETARAINARAYTIGSDVAFARGEYAPASTNGRRLIAHELSHVVQQDQSRRLPGRSGVQRQEPQKEQTPLEKLDEDLFGGSNWLTLDTTILKDLMDLPDPDKREVLKSNKRRDEIISRFSVRGVRTALDALHASDPKKEEWLIRALTLAGVKLVPDRGPEFNGHVDAELLKRFEKMVAHLIVHDRVGGKIILTSGRRSPEKAHIKSTTYHIIEGFVTLDHLKRILKESKTDEVKDLDGNLWYKKGWDKKATDARARKNRKIGDEAPSLAYEGYKVGNPRRLPNLTDPKKPPVSKHVMGEGLDATVRWKAHKWDKGVDAIIGKFGLERPFGKNYKYYGKKADESWHYEKS